MKEAVREKALRLGFDDCRFTSAAAPGSVDRFANWLAKGFDASMGYLRRGAEKRADLNLILPGAQSVISLATSYHSEDASDPDVRKGVVARYAGHADYHDVLAERLQALADFVCELNGPGTRALWYVDTGPILERDLAQRAGLGFVGKHTNLISRQLGNWFLISEILTTGAFEPDASERNRCGSCSRCLGACPTGAIVAPFELDARLCISFLTIELKGSIPTALRPLIGNRIFGCDDCLAACPWNRFAREGAIMKEHAREGLRAPVLLELLGLGEREFKERFAGTPFLRSRRRGLLRNVCVALGNTAGTEALPALKLAANDPEPLIAEHAAWAIEQIESRTTARGAQAPALKSS